MSSVVIIGSGLAGYTLAREIRKQNSDISLEIITADDGVYYSKPQLSSALTHHKSAEKLAMGSCDFMRKQLNATIHTETQVIKIDAQSQKICLSNKKDISYEKLVLAQGAETVAPPFSFQDPQKIISINNLIDYRKFRSLIENKKSVAILGAGLVGCEFSNDLLNGGFDVNVIALSDTPLELLIPPPLGKKLREKLSEKGIHWHLSQKIESLETVADKLHLTLSSGKLDCDVLISAIGLKPVISLAKNSGLKTNRGICVDRYLQTNVQNIYALGDCAEVEGHVLFYVAPLVTCARALALTLTREKTAVEYPPMPIYIKTPAYPVVCIAPPYKCVGEWKIISSDRALFYDTKNQLRGFALLGDEVNDKIDLVSKIPNLF